VKKFQLLLATALTLFLTLSTASARSHRKKSGGTTNQAAGSFDYYMLTLSWAPDFCALPSVPKDPAECGKGRHVNFIVHGLWPQSEQGRGPEHCGSASPVSQDIVRVMLNYIPTQSLIQHEWTNHGTCSGLSAADYFAAVRKTRDSVKLPSQFVAPSQEMRLSPAEIDAQFAAANPGFPKAAFKASCKNGELQEARICFDKNLSPRACTASAGECPAPTMTVRPVQ
jgi:ribonuclease T2